MILCGKMGKKYGMPEARPCMNKKNHKGPQHTYDLTGMKDVYGFKEILKRGPDYISSRKGKYAQWWVLDLQGDKRLIPQAHLFENISKIKRAPKKSGLGMLDKKGEVKPEYSTIWRHQKRIRNPNDPGHQSYKNMKFYTKWDPKVGGSYITGMNWIIKNLGPKPSLKYQLHVIKSKRYPHGYFGPGGIVWRAKMDRHDQDLLDLVCEWSKKKWSEFIKQENKRRSA